MPKYEPIREGALGAARARAWSRQAGLNASEQAATFEHVAGAKRANQLTDAYPFLEGAYDHGPRGAYRDEFKLAGARPLVVALVGDAHPTNFGAMPLEGLGAQQIVYGVVDPTHNGMGDLTLDVYRGTHTHVGTARAAGLSRRQQERVAAVFAAAYFKELRAYAETGQRPLPYLSLEEVKGKAAKALLAGAARADRDAAVAKFTGSPAGTILSPKYRLADDDPLRTELQRAFQQQYAARLPPELAGTVALLDLGTAKNLGGSNSELPHFYALARLGSGLRVIEIKQLIPSPVELAQGNPHLANATSTVAIAAALQPSPDPLMLPMWLGDRRYIAEPCDGRKQELDLGALRRPKDLVALARTDGRLMARVHAQSIDAQTLSGWLAPLDVPEAIATLRDYGMTYDAQAQADARAMKRLLRE